MLSKSTAQKKQDSLRNANRKRQKQQMGAVLQGLEKKSTSSRPAWARVKCCLKRTQIALAQDHICTVIFTFVSNQPGSAGALLQKQSFYAAHWNLGMHLLGRSGGTHGTLCYQPNFSLPVYQRDNVANVLKFKGPMHIKVNNTDFWKTQSHT